MVTAQSLVMTLLYQLIKSPPFCQLLLIYLFYREILMTIVCMQIGIQILRRNIEPAKVVGTMFRAWP